MGASDRALSRRRVLIKNVAILAAAFASLLALYWMQDWVFDRYEPQIRHLFSAGVLILGAGLVALVSDRKPSDIPWWYGPALMLVGSLIFVLRGVGAW